MQITTSYYPEPMTSLNIPVLLFYSNEHPSFTDFIIIVIWCLLGISYLDHIYLFHQTVSFMEVPDCVFFCSLLDSYHLTP